MNKKLKARKCKYSQCGNEFVPYTSLQQVCHGSIECALGWQKERKSDKFKQETREMKREHRLQDRRYQMSLAQGAFNAYIRERDKGRPCISSGRTTGQMHAGHYRSIGAHPELRFSEINVNLQSMKDNSWLSGNTAGYRRGLIERYGEDVVSVLEGPHEPKHYSLDEIIEIKETYRRRLKELTEVSGEE